MGEWLKRRGAPVLVAAVAAATIAIAAVSYGFVHGRATDARATMLAEMRATSDSCLEAALELRRVGSPSGMDRLAAQVESACRRVEQQLPALAEPNYRIARILRLQSREKDALREIELALAKEPSHGPALYERVLLLAALMGAQRHEVYRRRLMEAGEWLAREGGGVVRALTDDTQPIVYGRGDAEALKALQATLARLEAAAPPVRPAEMDLARATVLVLSGDRDRALELLRRAAADPMPPEDVFEALAVVEHSMRRWEEAIRWYDEAVKHDSGNGWLLVCRGSSRLGLGQQMADRGDDPIAVLSAARDDVSRAMDLGEQTSARMVRGQASIRISTWKGERGLDDAAELRAAIDDFEAAVKGPEATDLDWLNLAATLARIADRSQRRGENADALYARCMEAYDTALRLGPERASIHVSRALARMTRAVLGLDQGIRPEAELLAAMGDFGVALKLNPIDVDTWLARGLARIHLAAEAANRSEAADALFREAVADMGQAVRIAPTADRTWLNRGFAYLRWATSGYERGENRDEEHKLALADFDKARSLNARRPDVWQFSAQTKSNRAAYIALRGGDSEEEFRLAIADADEAVRLATAAYQPWRVRADIKSNLAVVRSWRGKPSPDVLLSALSDLDEAVKRHPGAIEAWITRGGLRLQLAVQAEGEGKDPLPVIKQALADYDEALRLNPASWEARLRRADTLANEAYVLIRRSDRRAEAVLRQAIETYDEALKRNPRRLDGRIASGRARMQLGVVLMGRGIDPLPMYEAANADYDRALAVQPDNPEARSGRGMTRHNRGLWYAAKGGGDAKAEFRAAIADYAVAARDPRLKAEAEEHAAACRAALGE